jgi:hypothetical protein
LGQGANGGGGTRGSAYNNVTGTDYGSQGSNGTAGSGGSGLLHGGGSGSARGASLNGRGAVRIIWGTGRSFPSTNTGNV